MTPNLLNLAAIAFYIITWVLVTRRVWAKIKAPDTTQEETTQPNKIYFLTWGLALVAHLYGIIMLLASSGELSFNFTALVSYVMWFISVILFISTISRKIQALAVVILPFTILSLVILMFSNLNADGNIQLNSGLGIHILVSLLAYSILTLAAVQAILLATQNNFLHKRLKNPQQSNFFRTLPALEDMEYFLFHLISVGVILLSISLLSGFYYLDNLFGSSVAHKTILSILSWIIFSALLFGRWKYGWRGKTAVRWTISGFAVLALAFFGSKFIQEFVIDNKTAKNTQAIHQIVQIVEFTNYSSLKMTPPLPFSELAVSFSETDNSIMSSFFGDATVSYHEKSHKSSNT